MKRDKDEEIKIGVNISNKKSDSARLLSLCQAPVSSSASDSLKETKRKRKKCTKRKTKKEKEKPQDAFSER